MSNTHLGHIGDMLTRPCVSAAPLTLLGAARDAACHDCNQSSTALDSALPILTVRALTVAMVQ